MKKRKISKEAFSKETVAASFRSRSFRVGGYSVAASAIVLAIVILVNVLVSALPVSITEIDTTSTGIYTLSQESKDMAEGLTQDVTIYWIVQSGYEDIYVEKLLEYYEALSGKLNVVKKDPDVYPTFVQRYNSSGTVYNNSLVVESGDRFRYIGYEEIYVYDYSTYYTTGTYTVEFDAEGLITSAIDYVTRESMPKMYVLTGHGEASLPTSFTSAVAKQNIGTESLSLLTVEAVPGDADCIFIYAPTTDISETEQSMLRAYLQEGGSLYLITQPTLEPLTRLEALMGDYGVTAEEGIVVEGNSAYCAWGTGLNLLPDLQSHEITAPLINGGYYVMLPVAQGLIVADALPDGVSVSSLLTTSDKAYSKTDSYYMATYEKEDGDIDGPFDLAAAISGADGEQIIWVTSGYLCDESTNSDVSGGNLDFFLNGLSWMCEAEEASYTIYAKNLDNEYLTMDASTASMLTTLVVAIIPLSVLAVGIVVWLRRKKK